MSVGDESVRTGEFPNVDLMDVIAFGITQNHPFLDGNKRTAFVVCRTFLILNHYDMVASQEEKYLTFLKLAEGRISEEELADWIRGRLTSAS